MIDVPGAALEVGVRFSRLGREAGESVSAAPEENLADAAKISVVRHAWRQSGESAAG